MTKPQQARIQVEDVGQGRHRLETRVHDLADFEFADVGLIESGPFGEFRLRQASAQPGRLQGDAFHPTNLRLLAYAVKPNLCLRAESL